MNKNKKTPLLDFLISTEGENEEEVKEYLVDVGINPDKAIKETLKNINSGTVYRILRRDNNELVGSFERAYHDKYDFESVSEARNANCHGIFKDKDEYKIAKYRVTYELIDDDCNDED